MYLSKFFIPFFVVSLLSGCQSTSEMLDNATASLKSVIPGNGIHALAAKGDTKGIQAIVEKKGDAVINERNDIGNTPLMMAAFKGQSKTVEYLLDNGAEVALKNKDGETAFHAAAQGNQPATFNLLKISHNKLAGKADYNQVTPYMRAAYSGINESFFSDLKDKDFYASDADGSDLLSWAVGGGNVSVTEYYGHRSGKDLNIDKLRKAHSENFDNAQSKQTLLALSEMYCNYALNNKQFKPQSGDSLKFGRNCGYDFYALEKQRNS